MIIVVEEQISKRSPKNGLRSTPITQKVWQQIQIAKYPQVTYSTFGSTDCGVSDLLHRDFWGGWGVFWSIKFQHFRIGSKLWTIISFYLIRQMGQYLADTCQSIRTTITDVFCVFFCVAMLTVYKETVSMGSNVNNNGCFDFRDKYTLPIYLECACNWYLLILQNCWYKIFCKFANQTIALSCNESWKLS